MSSARRPPTAAARRARFGTMSVILLAAATVSVIVLNVLGTRFAARFDVTSTGEHRLSPRSQSLLERLSGPYEVVVAAPLRDRAVTDPRALQALRDVLDQFRHARGGVTIRSTLIDTGSAAGIAEFEALLDRLAQRDAPRIQKQADAVATGLDRAEALAADMETLSPMLDAVARAIPDDAPGAATNRSYFEQRAAELRISAPPLRQAVGRARDTLTKPAGHPPIPDPERAAAPVLALLKEIEAGLNDIAENSRRFANAEGIPAPARDAAAPASTAAASLRDRVAVLRDNLERLERIDLVRIARTLQAGSAALVIGPPEAGVTAIDMAQLLPGEAAVEAAGGARADMGRRAEELIATAIASLAQPIKPIVMFIHGQPARGFLQSPDFIQLLNRLALRGIDAAEWAVSVDPEPPPLTRADPTGQRPVVYVVLSTDASQSAPARGQSGPERAAKVGRAVASLIEAGQPVLLSLNPSTLPTFGETDPMIAGLRHFGLTADTGRPILQERFAADGRHVDAWQVLTAETGDHPIAGAVRGLPARFEWPVAVRLDPEARLDGVKATPLYIVKSPAAWGESQWLSYWQVRIPEHDLVPNKPAKDAPRDDGAGPWPIVMAAERRGPDGPERLVVVGANTWFMDRIAQERALIDGRPAPTNPGNAELFEAAVYWLAGQDEMIAQSPTARAVPLIRPLGGGTLLVLRWAAIAGLPGLVLLLGVIWRMIRG